jgi:hypothetical protein
MLLAGSDVLLAQHSRCLECWMDWTWPRGWGMVLPWVGLLGCLGDWERHLVKIPCWFGCDLQVDLELHGEGSYLRSMDGLRSSVSTRMVLRSVWSGP